MPVTLPQELSDILQKRIPVRVLTLDLTITPDIFHFATRSVTINGTAYSPFLVHSGDFQSFGGKPVDRVGLRVQNIDKAMSGFFVSDALESAPATVSYYFPEADFTWILLKGHVSLVSLTGQFADFEVRSRFDPSVLRIPARTGQALCPWATDGFFDDGPSTDQDAMCPYRDVGANDKPGFTFCPGTLQDCIDRAMFDPDQLRFYFAGFPIQGAGSSGFRQQTRPKPEIGPADLGDIVDVIFQDLFSVG